MHKYIVYLDYIHSFYPLLSPAFAETFYPWCVFVSRNFHEGWEHRFLPIGNLFFPSLFLVPLQLSSRIIFVLFCLVLHFPVFCIVFYCCHWKNYCGLIHLIVIGHGILGSLYFYIYLFSLLREYSLLGLHLIPDSAVGYGIVSDFWSSVSPVYSRNNHLYFKSFL